MESIVRVAGLSHRYNKNWAIRDISFEIDKTSIYGLLGSNGAGKSTTMNILCRVLNQTDGRVLINGIDTRRDPLKAKKQIGFLPQMPPLYMDLTVMEYLLYCARLREIKESLISVAVEVEIAAALRRFLATPPKVLFVTDGEARNPFDSPERHYRKMANSLTNRYSLINQGYDIDTISLSNRQRIPLDAAVVVIADPRTPFSSESLLKISDYLDKGGNLLLACEPERKEVTSPILEKLGLKLREGMLIQPGDKGSDYVAAHVTDYGMTLTPNWHII